MTDKLSKIDFAFDIVDLVVSIGKAQTSGSSGADRVIEDPLVELIETVVQADEQQIGEPLDLSLIKEEAEI